MSYSAEERESCITTTDFDRVWKIYTLMPTIITKIKKAGVEPIKVDPDGAHHFELDFSQVSFRAKSKPREISDEQRLIMAERLSAARKAKQEAKQDEE